MSGYIGPLPVPQGIQRKQSFTATASQTTFNTNGYTDGDFINVYLNGVRLINGTDYTATNGSDIVLTTGASASDVLDFETFDTFSLVSETFENITTKNPTHEDTDGGRESAISFKGEQSGGEISTLAQIQASHDGTSDDQKGDLIFKTNDGSDNDAPTERARFDSAGRLLVGTTTVALYSEGSGGEEGTVVTGSGDIYNSNAGTNLILNRLTSDGDIADFRKDGTKVGSIASRSGATLSFVGNPSSGNGAGVAASTNMIIPSSETGAAQDNRINLGSTSTRWQDLYLSGGAYIGGTVAANYLDDYEEGLHQISVSSGGVSFNALYDDWRYTKIGRLVNVEGLFLASSSGNSDTLLVTLPFAYSSKTAGTADSVMGVVGSYQGPMGTSGLVCAIGHGSSTLAFRKLANNAVWTTVVGSDIDSGDHLYINITYPTG